MRVLLIDGDNRQASYLRKGLIDASGFSVDVARRGDEGIHLASEWRYDLVVLNTRLPDCQGADVLARLRQLADVPVFMLTARNGAAGRVLGLQQGADDCLDSPFAFSEFLARVQALLRRRRGAGNDVLLPLRLADLELDPMRRRAYRSGRALTLTAQEFALLLLLLRRQGEVLTRHELAEHLWGMNFDSDTNVIEVAIRRLRLKLDRPFRDKLLHTVRGMGYILEYAAPAATADSTD